MEYGGSKWRIVRVWWDVLLKLYMLSEIHLTMDAKRRISIPTRYRREIGKSVVITRHLDGCISVYPFSLWEKGMTQAQKLNKRLSINEKHRKISRFLTVGDHVDVDSSGRIVIPDHLANFAELRETIVCVGTEEGFQIWSSERWERDGMPTMDEVRALAESDEFQRLTDEPEA